MTEISDLFADGIFTLERRKKELAREYERVLSVPAPQWDKEQFEIERHEDLIKIATKLKQTRSALDALVKLTEARNS